MIRIKQIIKKNEIDSWSNKVHSLTILFHESFKLKDKNSYKVQLYYKLDTASLHMILSSCYAEREKLSPKDCSFVTGLQTQRALSFIRLVHLKRLIEIENKYKLNFSIPNKIREFVINY